MAISDADEAVLAAKFAVMRQVLDERQWRVYLGAEANALGYGGIAAVARAAGASENTVAAGAAEASDPGALTALAPGRSRRPGAGRPRAEDKRPGLTRALEALLEEGKRGDPMSEITWSTLSLRDIARQMFLLGFGVSKDTIARLMRAGGWSLQGMSRVLEGSQHEDRDGQFRHIAARIAACQAAGDPVISTDAKKKEHLGAYHRDGRSWRPAGDPVKVRDHDFRDKDTVRIVPYGIYDITANRGFVSVGTSHDTAAFAVNAIRLWWQAEGQFRYPAASRLLVTCDAGGSNGWQCRLWKDQLAVLAGQTGLRIEVCHFPPGTSKWNKIEHRLFCHITRTWKARPLMTKEDAVAGIAATTTGQGLKCTAVLDEGHYPAGQAISGGRMNELEDRVLGRHAFHGQWNYTVRPAPRPGPAAGPEPSPGPDLAALAALAGISDLAALLAAVTVPCQAAREQRLYLDRGTARRVTSGPAGPARLPLAAAVAAAACHHRAGVSYRLLGQILGVDASTVSLAARRITPALAQHAITPRYQRARIRTLGQLREHAAASGMPVTAITAQTPQKNRDDTPETVN